MMDSEFGLKALRISLCLCFFMLLFYFPDVKLPPEHLGYRWLYCACGDKMSVGLLKC